MSGEVSRLLKYFLLSLCLLLTQRAAGEEQLNADIYGTWKIIAIVGGGITSMNTRQMNAIIGKRVFVGTERFAFNGKTCGSPLYKRSLEDTADYFYRAWRVNSDGMPFGDKVTVVEAGDCNYLFPFKQDHIVVEQDAIFYEAVREGTKTVATPSPLVQADKGANKANADIFGTWTIDGADWKGSGYDSAAEKKKKAGIFMGMPIYISATRFFYNENQCKNPGYKRSRQEKTTYFHGDWRAAEGRLLFLPKILTVVETDCGTIYPINKKLIIIEDKRGMFFTAVPISVDTPD